MKQQQHTPGPWYWSRDTMENRCDITLDSEATGYSILYCCEKPREPNARLIAAAPDLLDQLINARNRLADMLKGDDGQAWQEAERAMASIEAAINKALGE